MNISGGKLLVIGGAGLIGSHVVQELLKEEVEEIIVYDNFCRGTHENLETALKDPRGKVFEIGRDAPQTERLDAAMNT